MTIRGQRTIKHESASGDVYLIVDFTKYDGNAWECNGLRIAVSYVGELESSELAVDFLDQDGNPVKRVFRDSSGALDFVSDCLGLYWLVPRRSANDRPMELRVQATGVGGAGVGAATVTIELWYEARENLHPEQRR